MGDSSGRTKQSAPPSATPTKEQLIAELESLDNVQARIDCIAADLASKTNRYDALDAYELGELIDLEAPGNWPRCRYARKPADPSFENSDKPLANHITFIESSLPEEVYAALERKAEAIINSKQSSDLAINDIVEILAEAYYQEIDQFTDANPFGRGLEFPSSFLDKLDLSADGYNHDFSSDSEFEVYREDITGEIAGWVEDDLLPYVRELYRKKYPDRKASDAEQILAIDGFGPKEVCSVLLDQAERVAVKNRPLDFGGIAWELIELPKTALDEMFRSVTFGTPGSQEQTFEISDFGDWIRGRGSVEEELERLVKEHFIPKMEQWYYEAHQGAHPDWEPEEPQQSDIALAFTSVKASNGTELHFQVLVGDSGEETDMCSPYDIEAGNGCDLSDYVDVPW